MSLLMLDSGINRQGAFSLGIFKLLLQRRIYTVEIDDASQGVLIQAPIRRPRLPQSRAALVH